MDELVKRLREADEKSMCGECGLNLHTGATKKGVLFAEAADAIEGLQKKLAFEEQNAKAFLHTAHKLLDEVPRWIPVTERLPECEGERVLVASNSWTLYLRVSICYFSKSLEDVDKYDFEGEQRSGFYDYDSESGYYERQCVRYWMPLPEPPKGE